MLRGPLLLDSNGPLYVVSVVFRKSGIGLSGPEPLQPTLGKAWERCPIGIGWWGDANKPFAQPGYGY